MGQYYKIINLTKKEYLESWDYDCGAKLMESSYIARDLTSNPYISAFCGLLCNEWEGDEVVVVGDYADIESGREYDMPWLDALEDIQKRYPELEIGEKRSNEYGEYCQNLYKATKSFKKIVTDKYKDFVIPQYLCNSASGEYIDLKDLPIEWPGGRDEKGEYPAVSVNPLPLLLALGNGMGLGDYRDEDGNEYLVGSWAYEKYSKGIYFSNTIPEGYEEFRPDFTENEEVIRDERQVF